MLNGKQKPDDGKTKNVINIIYKHLESCML